MCGKKKDEGECSQSIHSLQGYQEQFFLQQQQYQYGEGYIGVGGEGGGGRGSSLLQHPEVSHHMLPWTFPQVLQQPYNPVHFSSNPTHAHDLLIPPPTSSYGDLFNTRPSSSSSSSLQFGSSSNHPLRILSDSLGQMGHHQPGSTPFGGLQSAKMSAQEIMDAKALAASKSHSEAERRRRERINNHLAKLRSLLPSTTKTDKASLLAEVIQHVKELKRQTSQIAEGSPVPTETDELTVDASEEDGKLIIKASLCCEDKSDLLPELIKTLKALKLRTLKAEITTLGGRVKNVLFITREEEQVQPKNNIDQQELQQVIISSIQDALKAVMERIGSDDSSSGSTKRQRTNMDILDHQQRSL